MPAATSKHKPTPHRTPPNRVGWRLLKWFTLSCALVMLALAVLIWQSLYQPLKLPAQGKLLRINEGDSYSTLIRQLDQAGQIRHPIIVKIYQRFFVNTSLKTGVYQVNSGLNARELLHRLADGSMAKMLRITLIEGNTFKQLRTRIAATDGVTNTLQGVNDQGVLLKIGAKQTHPEGWFAPETYYFNYGETDQNILKHLYQKQQSILQQEWEARAPNLPYQTAYDALIMASIVEKETGLAAERFDVSAVFRNRLKIGMRLQTDPTVIYGMGEAYQGNIRKVDLQTPTAYNTYSIDGLPPTPIASPSRAAINATLHPSNSEALYFVATGTGGHRFSRTYTEHQAAVAEYLAVLKSRRNREQQ